jgi:hypothetical protein
VNFEICRVEEDQLDEMTKFEGNCMYIVPTIEKTQSSTDTQSVAILLEKCGAHASCEHLSYPFLFSFL